MPLYEYACTSCGHEFTVLVLKKDEETGLVCEACGGGPLKRLISRTVYHMSQADRLAQYDPSKAKSDSFYKDTRNIGLHAQKRARQLGVDLGSSFEAKLEKLRTDPGSVIRDSE